MQVGRCPQCGEKVGGKHHTMLSTNRRLGDVRKFAVTAGDDVKFEDIEGIVTSGVGGGRMTDGRRIKGDTGSAVLAADGETVVAGTCGECLKGLAVGDDIVTLSCHCLFHVACVERHFELSRKCPSCKRRVKGKQFATVGVGEDDEDGENDLDGDAGVATADVAVTATETATETATAAAADDGDQGPGETAPTDGTE